MQPAPGDDPDSSPALVSRVLEEKTEFLLGFRPGQSVQVQVAVEVQFSALQELHPAERSLGFLFREFIFKTDINPAERSEKLVLF